MVINLFPFFQVVLLILYLREVGIDVVFQLDLKYGNLVMSIDIEH